MVTHSSPISEVGGSNPGPYVGKLVTDGLQLYVLVSSAHKTTHRDMTCTVLKTTLILKLINKSLGSNLCGPEFGLSSTCRID